MKLRETPSVKMKGLKIFKTKQRRAAAPGLEPQATGHGLQPLTLSHGRSGPSEAQSHLPDGLPRLVELLQDALHVFVDFAVFPVHGKSAPTARRGFLTSQLMGSSPRPLPGTLRVVPSTAQNLM